MAGASRTAVIGTFKPRGGRPDRERDKPEVASRSATMVRIMPAERAPDVTAEVEQLFALVRERYGGRLTPAQLDEVHKGVDAVVQAARALRAVRLANGDEPMQPFIPFRADS